MKGRGPSKWASSVAAKAPIPTLAQICAELPPSRHAVLGNPHGLRESKNIHGVSVPSAPRLPPSFAVVSDGECGDSHERHAPLQLEEPWAALGTLSAHMSWDIVFVVVSAETGGLVGNPAERALCMPTRFQ